MGSERGGILQALGEFIPKSKCGLRWECQLYLEWEKNDGHYWLAQNTKSVLCSKGVNVIQDRKIDHKKLAHFISLSLFYSPIRWSILAWLSLKVWFLWYDVTVPDFVYTVQRYISAKIRDQRDKRKIANIISKSQEHSFDNPHFLTFRPLETATRMSLTES